MFSSQKDNDNPHHKTDDGKRKHSIDKKMVHELAASTSIEKSGKEKSWRDTENADQSPKKTDDMKPGNFFLKGHLFSQYLQTKRLTDCGLPCGGHLRCASTSSTTRAGTAKPSSQKNDRRVKLLEIAAESPASGARFVSHRFCQTATLIVSDQTPVKVLRHLKSFAFCLAQCFAVFHPKRILVIKFLLLHQG